MLSSQRCCKLLSQLCSHTSRGQWTTVEITQREEGDSYRYTVKVRGVNIGSVINKQAREFTNVKVFGADNWYNAAKGRIW